MELGTRLDPNSFVGEAAFTEIGPFFHIYIFGQIHFAKLYEKLKKKKKIEKIIFQNNKKIISQNIQGTRVREYIFINISKIEYFSLVLGSKLDRLVIIRKKLNSEGPEIFLQDPKSNGLN